MFIRSQRKLAQLSLRQMAELTNLSHPYLSQVERRLHQPWFGCSSSSPKRWTFRRDAPHAGPTTACRASDVNGPDEARELELTKSQCFELLAGQRLGRLAFVDERGPIVLPVNFVLDNYMVIIRTDEGTKLTIARHGDRVAFEADAIDTASGAAWSVLIRGEAIEVTDRLELDRLSKLRLRPWAPGRKSHIVRILPAAVTGRRIPLPDIAGNQDNGP